MSNMPLTSTSIPKPYVSDRTSVTSLNGDRVSMINQQRASIRQNFFRTELATPPLLTSILNERKLSVPKVDTLRDSLSLPKVPQTLDKTKTFVLSSSKQSDISTSSTPNGKKYYETDLDFTIKVPKKSESFYQEKNSDSSSSSRVINISVTKSESLNFVSMQNEANNTTAELNKENADDMKIHPSNDKSLFRSNHSITVVG